MIKAERPRVRIRSSTEAALACWETALVEDRLGQWAMNLMLINVRRASSLARCACPAAMFLQHSGDEGRWTLAVCGVAPLRVTLSEADE